jgi:hypothetical protein
MDAQLFNHAMLWLRIKSASQQLSTKRGPAIRLIAEVEKHNFGERLLMRRDENVALLQFNILFVRGAVELPKEAQETAIGYITYIPGSEIPPYYEPEPQSFLSCLVSLSEWTFDDLWLRVRKGLDQSTRLSIEFGQVKLEGSGFGDEVGDKDEFIWLTEQSPILSIFEVEFTFDAIVRPA